MNSEECFWMVWNATGGSPFYRHSTPTAARKEAERLANLNPGQSFYVVLATSVSRATRPVETVDLRNTLPF